MIGRRTALAALGGLALLPLKAARAKKDQQMIVDNILELRQYTLFGGKRDTLIELFEREFIDPQNAVGAHVVGTFTDLDDPDRFVWLRGFSDMATRARSLGEFYSGPVWKTHRNAANATMVDSDNVLLLHPLGPAEVLGTSRSGKHGVVAVHIYSLGDVDAGEFARWFDGKVRPVLARNGARDIATFGSETSPNNFPALPVRADRVFIWLATWPNEKAARAFDAAWSRESGWRDDVPPQLLPALARKAERLLLHPTPRSPFGGKP